MEKFGHRFFVTSNQNSINEITYLKDFNKNISLQLLPDPKYIGYVEIYWMDICMHVTYKQQIHRWIDIKMDIDRWTYACNLQTTIVNR